jgi:hypothetical protein
LVRAALAPFATATLIATLANVFIRLMSKLPLI